MIIYEKFELIKNIMNQKAKYIYPLYNNIVFFLK